MKDKNKFLMVPIGMIALLVMAALVATVLTKEFDAKSYVSAVLEQTYHGDVEKAYEIMDNVTEEELKQQYEAGISSFVKNNIISGIEVDTKTEEKFITLGKEIFKAMKFEVLEQESISDEEYQVAVSYQSSDVFLKYVDYIQQESEYINEKVEDGVYKGTVEEINEQIQKEFITSAYALLEKAYEDMEYDDAEETKFNVTANSAKLYKLNEEELHDFMLKIMKLDQIQD